MKAISPLQMGLPARGRILRLSSTLSPRLFDGTWHPLKGVPLSIAVLSGSSGLREYLTIERKRVPGGILYEADRLETRFFSGYDPHFEGDEPPGLSETDRLAERCLSGSPCSIRVASGRMSVTIVDTCYDAVKYYLYAGERAASSASSLAGWSPPAPASASPSRTQYAIKSSCRSRSFQRTANCVLTVCLTPGDHRTFNVNSAEE